METDLNTVVEAINAINTMLTDKSTYIEQYIQRLETFMAFLTAVIVVMLFVLIRRRGHKKIM